MGRGDDFFLDDNQADDAMRRVLTTLGELAVHTPPPNLVTRTLRRLPPEPPEAVARRAERHRRIRAAMTAAWAGLALIFAGLGLWGLLGGGLQLAALFGDGSAGLSRAILTWSLLMKPLVRSGALMNPAVLGTLLAAAAGGSWLWWWVVQRTPVAIPAEAQR